jgi:hypothetical protein
MAAPTIALHLGLIVQPIQRTDSSRASVLTFAVNVSGTPSLSVAQDAINDFQDNFATNIMPLVDTDAQALAPTIRLGDGSSTPFEAIGGATPAAGSSTDDKVPPQVACLVKKVTGLGGKANRGRTYYPYMLDQGVVNESGTIGSTALAALQTAVDTFFNQLITDTIPMVIANRVFSILLGRPVLTAYELGPAVQNLIVESLVATQRRRVRS